VVDAGPILTSVARGGLLKAAGIRAAWSEPGAASLTQGDGLPGQLEIALLLRFLDQLSLPRPSERQVTAKKPCPKDRASSFASYPQRQHWGALRV
jgi:hypothetical protein